MTCYVPNPMEKEWYTPENFNNSFGDYVNSRNRKPWSVSLRNLPAPRGEIRMLNEVSDAKLKYVPGTEASSRRKLFPARERIKRDHDYEWHATVIEIVGPWAYGWIPGPRGWRPTENSKPRESPPVRYGDFCPWRLNFAGMNFPYALDVIEGDEEDGSGAILPPKNISAAQVLKKKKIRPKQSSTTVMGEVEAQEEVTSPVNEEFAEDEITDGEERTGTSPINVGEEVFAGHAGDEGRNKVVMADDVVIGDVSVPAGDFADTLPTSQEFSFDRMYSTGEFFDEALDFPEDFSLLSLNDDWDVLGGDGNGDATVEDVGAEEPAVHVGAEEHAEGVESEKGKSVVDAPADSLPQSPTSEGEDAIMDWFKEKKLLFVSHPAPVVAGEKESTAYTRRMMEMSSKAQVSEAWGKRLTVPEATLVSEPPTSVADMMAIADGYQYGFPQQRVLEMMRSEHCNHVLYQFFKAKSLKLESKLRHREKELSAAEVEIEELKKSLKEKEKLGEAEADLRSELVAVRAELEQTRSQVSTFTELEGRLRVTNEKLEKAQSSLAQQEEQTNHFKNLAATREEAVGAASGEVNRLSSLLSQAQQRTTVIKHKARCQLAEETNKMLERIELGLRNEHGLVKNYPRRPVPSALPSSSGPSSGGSVPSSLRNIPADGAAT